MCIRILTVVALLFCGSLFAYKSYAPDNTLDTHMTPGEEKTTGVDKLTPAEKKSLQKWINKHHVKRPGAKPNEYPTISEVIGGGAYISLSDGSLWKISPSDRAITQSWITPVEIIPEESKDGTYPYTLTNSLTGSKVRAEKVDSLPAELRKEPPPSKKVPFSPKAKESLSSWIENKFWNALNPNKSF